MGDAGKDRRTEEQRRRRGKRDREGKKGQNRTKERESVRRMEMRYIANQGRRKTKGKKEKTSQISKKDKYIDIHCVCVCALVGVHRHTSVHVALVTVLATGCSSFWGRGLVSIPLTCPGS